MKKYFAVLSLAIFCVLGLAALTVSRAAVEPPAAAFQYAIIRLDDAKVRPNPYVVWPNRQVEFYGDQLAREKAPEGCDPHSYFMSLVVNILAREGYEFAGMTDAQIVMKRAERR